MIPILISAIGNVFVSLFWISWCLTAFLAIPLIVLCAYEFRIYLKVDDIRPQQG